MTKFNVEVNPTVIFLSILAVYLLAILFIQPHLNGFTLFYSYGDLLSHRGYFEQSIWVDTEMVPYKDIFVEYPPIGLYLYSLPRIFFNIYSHEDFLYAFIFLALFPLIGIYHLLYKQTPQAILFLCTPSFFYYSLARYDVFPAFFTLLAVILILNKKQLWGALLLGLAIGIKWYAVVLILPMLALVDNKIKWLTIVFFSGLFFCLHNMIYAGFDGAMSSYLFHSDRIFNQESIYYLLHKYWWPDELLPWTKDVFLLLQFLPSLLLALFLYYKKAILNKSIVSLSATISILGFIFFAKFNSPQWLVWLIPFVILLGYSTILWSYLALDIANFIVVPVTNHIVSTDTAIFDSFNFIRALLMVLLLVLCVRKLWYELNLNQSIEAH